MKYSIGIWNMWGRGAEVSLTPCGAQTLHLITINYVTIRLHRCHQRHLSVGVNTAVILFPFTLHLNCVTYTRGGISSKNFLCWREFSPSWAIEHNQEGKTRKVVSTVDSKVSVTSEEQDRQLVFPNSLFAQQTTVRIQTVWFYGRNGQIKSRLGLRLVNSKILYKDLTTMNWYVELFFF